MKGSIIVADDEEVTRKNIARLLSDEGLTVYEAADGVVALETVKEFSPDILVTDIKMPGLDGISLLKDVRDVSPQTMVIVMTAYASIDSAVEALRLGAQDYIRKPLMLDDLLLKIERLLDYRSLMLENQMLRREIQRHFDSGEIVGESRAIRDLIAMVAKVAPSDANVLITGESGVGKEVVARMLHNRSSRKDKIFLPVNCSAIPENLLESQLFGHVRGAFTGAVNAQEGLFQRAGQGTIFLDEIGDMPLTLQPKILRAIEERQVLPVGATRQVPIDVRIIAATHRDLAQEIAKERFREDLYYRLNVIRIHIPPLRERRSDIPLLAEQLVQRHNREMKRTYKGLSNDATKLLMSLSWNGNVRELDNVLERAMILGNGEWIEAGDLPSLEADSQQMERVHSAAGHNLQDAVDAYEKAHIENVLKEVSNDRTRAAELLGMSRSSLYRKMGRLKIGGNESEHEEKDNGSTGNVH